MHPNFEEFIDRFLPDEWAVVVKQLYELNWEQIKMLRASSTGKYHHHVENRVPYGLINHIMRTVWVAHELCIEEQGKYNLNSFKRNEVVTAAFLHDFGKMLTFKQTHAQLSLKYLQVSDITDHIRDMIAHHHHHWDMYPCATPWERIVAYADYVASRPEVEIEGLEYLGPEDEKDDK